MFLFVEIRRKFRLVFVLVATVNEILRLPDPDDDAQVVIQGPEASRIAKKRATKKRLND